MANIAIVGFMGTGKTAVAKALSKRLKMKYVSTDDLIEKREGISISEIFSEKKEKYFRRVEKDVVKKVSHMENVVIDAGGGVVIDPDNVENLRKKGIIICLWAGPETILARTKESSERPLLDVDNPLERIMEMLKYRKPFYERANYHIDTTNKSVEKVLGEVEDITKDICRTEATLKKIYKTFSDEKRLHRVSYIKSIHALINLTESRDPYTKRHSVKVSNHAVLLAEYMALSKKAIETIRFAAVLHDIGKVDIRAVVLLKKSSLNKREYEEVKKHPQASVKMLRPLKFSEEIISTVKHHHENYDGTGYPDGLKKEEIPLTSRILSIADVYDALTSERAYRKAYSSKDALNIMTKDSGKKFDPLIFKDFKKCLSSKISVEEGAPRQTLGATYYRNHMDPLTR